MSLAELLTKIKEVKPLAEENVTTGEATTLNARRGRQRQAAEQLVRLYRAYTNELMRTAAFIVVIGDKREEFSTLAVDNFKCLSSDPDTYFADLASRVPSSLYLGKESVSNIFDILGRHIEEKAHELDIVGYPQLIFRQEYQQSLRTPADFLKLVRQAVTDQMGGEIVGIQAAHSLTKDAIEKGNTAKFTPIVLTTQYEKFGLRIAQDLGRISTRVFLVKSGATTVAGTDEFDAVLEDVSKEEVKKVLKNISNSLKK